MITEKKFCFIILDLLLLVYFAELVFPRMVVFGKPSVICLACVFSWILLSFLLCPNFYKKSNIHSFFVLLFYFALIFIPFVMGYPIIAHRYMAMAMIPIGPLMYEFYNENGLLSHLKKILTVTFFLSSLTLITTTIALLKNPYVSRTIKSSGDATMSLYAQGIAGYGFIYFIVVCNQIVLFLFLKSKGAKKIIFLSICIFLSFFIIKSNYFTALLFMLIGFATMLTIYFWKGNLLHKLLLCFLVFFIFFFIFEFQSIFSLVGDLLPQRIYRVFDVGNTNFLSVVTEEFFSDRWPFMKISFETFINHPLGGLLLSNELDFSSLGQHSYILDTFALYGVILGTVNIFVLLKPFKKNGLFVKQNMSLTIPIMITSLGLYFFNNATESISLAICFYYSIVRDLFSDGIESSNLYKKNIF